MKNRPIKNVIKNTLKNPVRNRNILNNKIINVSSILKQFY